ncbi:hypothetical protein Xen7305DRAFT_00052120 [Xenococcus sp. PCC 7305]|uniref:hypothetical protein n=1 Tax=Xenococcus sp. PCC 7305 TaxID=102125 RepID=UPI0002ACEE02|nr:hypothetical protein [Xenococcus sp. PCC 7305]ELS05467.1 hypothetical protein Xen7305DRAFT_00052120 [Xenococcus sp. PCC 7305]
MISFFDFQKSNIFNGKFAKILKSTIKVFVFLTEKLSSHSWETHVSNDNKPPRKPAVLNVDSVTVFWIVAAFLFIPLILTGLLSQ